MRTQGTIRHFVTSNFVQAAFAKNCDRRLKFCMQPQIVVIYIWHRRSATSILTSMNSENIIFFTLIQLFKVNQTCFHICCYPTNTNQSKIRIKTVYWKLKTENVLKTVLQSVLKGVFAKIERGYRLDAIKKLFWSLLILLLSVASIGRKLLMTSHTE